MKSLTAISKLTIYAQTHPQTANDCFTLIDIITENITIRNEKYDFNEFNVDFEDVIKTIFSKIFLANQELLDSVHKIYTAKKSNYDIILLNTISKTSKLIKENTHNIEMLKTLFDLQIEQKLDYDLSKFYEIKDNHIERATNLGNFTQELLQSFPFIKIAQHYIKYALELQEEQDAKKIENKLPDVREKLAIYKKFKEINDDIGYFSDEQTISLNKAVSYTKKIVDKRNLYVQMELYDYDPWESMHFSKCNRN